MRRTANSITNNIAEGHGRWHYSENIQFSRIARGSVQEILEDLNIFQDEKYIEKEEIEKLKKNQNFFLIKLMHPLNT